MRPAHPLARSAGIPTSRGSSGNAISRHLVDLQRRLLSHAVELVEPGGMIVFCTCSLEPEEGEHQIAECWRASRGCAASPIEPAEFPGLDGLV